MLLRIRSREADLWHLWLRLSNKRYGFCIPNLSDLFSSLLFSREEKRREEKRREATQSFNTDAQNLTAMTTTLSNQIGSIVQNAQNAEASVEANASFAHR